MSMIPRHRSLAESDEVPLPRATAEPVAVFIRADDSQALLAELTASVEASLAALLARDPVRLEQATRDQRRLQRMLSALWTAPLWTWHETHRTNLRPAMLRLRHLGRVHAALLAREQRWHNLLGNLVSGPAAAYRRPGHSAHSVRGSKCDDLNHDNLNQNRTSREEGGSPWEA